MTPRPWANRNQETFWMGAANGVLRAVLGAVALIALVHGMLLLFGFRG